MIESSDFIAKQHYWNQMPNECWIVKLKENVTYRMLSANVVDWFNEHYQNTKTNERARNKQNDIENKREKNVHSIRIELIQ